MPARLYTIVLPSVHDPSVRFINFSLTSSKKTSMSDEECLLDYKSFVLLIDSDCFGCCDLLRYFVLHVTHGCVSFLQRIRSVAVRATRVYWFFLSWSRCWGWPWHASGLRSCCCPAQFIHALSTRKKWQAHSQCSCGFILCGWRGKKTLWTWTHLGQPAWMTVVFFLQFAGFFNPLKKKSWNQNKSLISK